VFRLKEHAEEIESILTGKSRDHGIAEPVTGGQLMPALLDRLLDMTPKEFEEFIGHLLTLCGFEATVTQLVGDKGIDVVGLLNAEGLADVGVQVQVKRTKSTIGNQDILQLRGTLGQDEHGAFVCLGKFSRSAQEEAQSPGKKAIKLIDGQTLAQMILSQYENLAERYKQFLSLHRRNLPLVDQFFIQPKP
jgi:restriction endonuclease Mrr